MFEVEDRTRHDILVDNATLTGLHEVPDVVLAVCDGERSRKDSRRPPWNEFLKKVRRRGIFASEEAVRRAWTNVPTWMCNPQHVEAAIQSILFEERAMTQHSVVNVDSSARNIMPSLEDETEHHDAIQTFPIRLPTHVPRGSTTVASSSSLVPTSRTSAVELEF